MQDIVAREHAVRQWSANPCGAVTGDEASLDYFLEVERNRYDQQPWQRARFRFDQYAGERVLEIGVGLGTDLVQFAKAGAVCHGIDITDRHLELTARNFALRGLPVELKKCDAARIDYPAGHFDVVYSFGVIHHILFHLFMVFVRGILLGRLFRLGYAGLMATIEGGADGVTIKPYVKVYSRREAKALLAGFAIEHISVHHLEIGRFRTSPLGRLATPLLRRLEPLLGWYVVCEANKR